MAGIVRRLSAAVAGAAVVVGAVLAGSGTVAPGAARLAAPSVDLLATALVMGGTGEILSIGPNTPRFIADYVARNYDDFISPTGLCSGGDDPGCTLTAVYTPNQMWPLTGLADMALDASVEAGRANLDACLRGLPCTITLNPYTATGVQSITDSVFVVNGQSQSAMISTVEKRHLIAHPVPGASIRFVLVANPNRPNGGLLERFVGAYIPLLGMDFNGATPTNSPDTNPMTTVDVSRQYDGWSDFPVNPLNLLAVLNALMGTVYLHDSYNEIDSPPVLQGRFQDSTYYLYPTELLPLLMPLGEVPVIGTALAKALDAPLRVLVETGYNRTINPGQPTPAKWLYVPNPITTLVNFVVAIPTGWDDAIAYVSGDPLNRPFHTAPQPVFGVGGPPVDAGSIDPYGPPPVLPAAGEPARAEAEAAAATVVRKRPAPSSAAPTRRDPAARSSIATGPEGATRAGAAAAVAGLKEAPVRKSLRSVN